MAVKSRSVLPYLVPKVSRQHPHPQPTTPCWPCLVVTPPSSPADRSTRQHRRPGLPVLGGRRRSHAPPRGHPARATLLPQGEAGDGGRGSGKDAATTPRADLGLVCISRCGREFIDAKIEASTRRVVVMNDKIPLSESVNYSPCQYL